MTLILTLIVIGVILYLVERVLPIDGTIKMIIRAVVVIGTIVYLLKHFGMWVA